MSDLEKLRAENRKLRNRLDWFRERFLEFGVVKVVTKRDLEKVTAIEHFIEENLCHQLAKKLMEVKPYTLDNYPLNDNRAYRLKFFAIKMNEQDTKPNPTKSEE